MNKQVAKKKTPYHSIHKLQSNIVRKDKCPKCGTPYEDPSFRMCIKCGHIPDEDTMTEERLAELEEKTGFNFR